MALPQLVHIVDDDAAVRDALGRLLTAEGFDVRVHASAEALLAELPDEAGGCVVTDLHMPGMTGLQLIEALRARGHAVPCVLVTGRPPRGPEGARLAALACEMIEKPFGPDEVVAAVRRAMGQG